jgi:hypothetical protein
MREASVDELFEISRKHIDAYGTFQYIFFYFETFLLAHLGATSMRLRALPV